MTPQDERIHRLSRPQAKVWLSNPSARKEYIMPWLWRYYGGQRRPITVCDISMLVLGNITPEGNCRLMPHPRPRLEPWMCHNPPSLKKPSADGGCICQDYFHERARASDPEGRWGSLGTGTHHPACEYTQGAMGNYKAIQREHNERKREQMRDTSKFDNQLLKDMKTVALKLERIEHAKAKRV